MHRQGWVVAMALAAGVAFAGPLPVAQLQGGRFNEVLRPEAPVAGYDVMGLAVDSGKRKVNALRLYVRRPSDATSPSPVGTSHVDLFQAASPQTLAVLARVDSCSARSDRLLPLAWGTPPDSGALRLVVSVQSGRTSASLIVNESSSGQQGCAPMTEGRRTAFDAVCGLELPLSERRPVSLRVRRCAFDDCTNSPLVYIDL